MVYEVIKGQTCTSKYNVKRTIKCDNGNTITDIHNGVDIVSSVGSKDLLALNDGKVLFTTENDGTGSKTIVCVYGNILPYNMRLLVLYAHCNSIKVKSGAKITKGQTIAEIGKTGNATGIHCHCSMYALPPLTWCSRAGKYYKWDYKTREQYEIDPNEILKLY